MIETATGLVLRTRPLTETSLIAHWLTDRCGRLSTVAKGARRPKSSFRGKIDVFYSADLSFSRSRTSELHTLREVVLRDPAPELREDLSKLQRAGYAAALIEQTTETDTPLPEIYQLMKNFLAAVRLAPSDAQTVLAFELKLLSLLGLQPETAEARLDPGEKQALKLLTDAEWDYIARLKLSLTQLAALRDFLHGFLIYHLGRIPRGRSAALQVLS